MRYAEYSKGSTWCQLADVGNFNRQSNCHLHLSNDQEMLARSDHAACDTLEQMLLWTYLIPKEREENRWTRLNSNR